uniref:Uncharacterized protein n=1 Tax=Anguilla anguilla TaxID=7936 RepID=A0A0E9U689_ANGAN
MYFCTSLLKKRLLSKCKRNGWKSRLRNLG